MALKRWIIPEVAHCVKGCWHGPTRTCSRGALFLLSFVHGRNDSQFRRTIQMGARNK